MHRIRIREFDQARGVCNVRADVHPCARGYHTGGLNDVLSCRCPGKRHSNSAVRISINGEVARRSRQRQLSGGRDHRTTGRHAIHNAVIGSRITSASRAEGQHRRGSAGDIHSIGKIRSILAPLISRSVAGGH